MTNELAKTTELDRKVDLVLGQLPAASEQERERFAICARSFLGPNSPLHKCEPVSVLKALANCARLNLHPVPTLGLAYILPFKNRGKEEATLIVGYRGWIQLCYRSGMVRSVFGEIVRENDVFEPDLGSNRIKHSRDWTMTNEQRGKPIAAYAGMKLSTGGTIYYAMGYDEALEHGRRFSKAFDRGPWGDTKKGGQEGMVLKTCIHRLCKKQAPFSPDVGYAAHLEDQADQGMPQDDPRESDIETVIDIGDGNIHEEPKGDGA